MTSAAAPPNVRTAPAPSGSRERFICMSASTIRRSSRYADGEAATSDSVTASGSSWRSSGSRARSMSTPRGALLDTPTKAAEHQRREPRRSASARPQARRSACHRHRGPGRCRTTGAGGPAGDRFASGEILLDQRHAGRKPSARHRRPMSRIATSTPVPVRSEVSSADGRDAPRRRRRRRGADLGRLDQSRRQDRRQCPHLRIALDLAYFRLAELARHRPAARSARPSPRRRRHSARMAQPCSHC